MRTFFLITVVLAVLIGWRAGGGSAPAPAGAQEADASGQLETIPGTVKIGRGSSGHFMVAGYAAGTPLTFMVDTGASEVALGRTDAERAGIKVSDADFDGEARTASGTIRIAHMRLPRVRIGEIQLVDVDGLVLDIPEVMPLLGQSFLSRIDKVAIEGDRMTLTKL